MLLIAREKIAGIHSDAGLFALNGIVSIYVDTFSVHEAIDVFESMYPDFRWYTIDIRKVS